MYIDAFEEQVYNRLDDKLGKVFDIRFGAGELSTEESIKALANRVGVKPNLLINLAPMIQQTGQDTTHRVSTDSVQIEILVAVSDARSLERQRREAIKYAFGTRYALQGYNLTSDWTANAPLVFETAAEEINAPGLCVYSVVFTVSVIVDIDEFEI